jgi:two-component system chemotaxis response regulator CheB
MKRLTFFHDVFTLGVWVSLDERYKLRKWLAEGGPAEVILLGASTGGPDALTVLLRDMPVDSPPVVVVQHIAPAMAGGFAARLAKNASLKLGDFRMGTLLRRGHIYLSHESLHIAVRSGITGPILVTNDGPPEGGGHRPSVDHMFRDAARYLHECRIFAALMTGMGRDGAEGLKCLKDQSSCAVFGMPKEAIRIGAVHAVGNLSQIRHWMEYTCGLTKRLLKVA